MSNKIIRLNNCFKIHYQLSIVNYQLQSMAKKFFRFFINKYVITTVIFIVWLFFFDSNNILTNLTTRDKLNELKKQKKFYLDEIEKDSIMIQKLLYDTSEIEKFAREKFQMKKKNEDVFLIIDTTTGDQRQ